MTRQAIGVLAAVGLLMGAVGTASASERDVVPSEPGLGVAQVGAGFGAAFGGMLLSAGGAATAPPVGLVAFLGTPSAVGLAVCGVGSASDHYRGSCGAAIGGAYVGALSMLPLAYIGYHLTESEGGDGWDGLGGALAGMAVGWLVVQPLASTLGWQISKRPRQQVDAPVWPPPRPQFMPPVRSQGRHRAPGQMTVGLLSAGF